MIEDVLPNSSLKDRKRFRLYKRFLDGVPEYLVRNYWWAYLWSVGIWFFDHQPIINAILFGNYNSLMKTTLKSCNTRPMGRTLQLTCVYGKLTPKLMDMMDGHTLHLADVAHMQLDLAKRKTEEVKGAKLASIRMNAEYQAYCDDAFDTVLLFFLLHEMPPEARKNTLAEVVRVLRPGGRLILTEYGHLPRKHFLHRFLPSRWILSRLEPFLPGFWHEDVAGLLRSKASDHKKTVQCIEQHDLFKGFYNVAVYKVDKMGSM